MLMQTVSVNRAPGSQAYFNGLVYFHGYNTAALKAYQVQSDGKLSVAAVGTGGWQFTVFQAQLRRSRRTVR